MHLFTGGNPLQREERSRGRVPQLQGAPRQQQCAANGGNHRAQTQCLQSVKPGMFV